MGAGNTTRRTTVRLSQRLLAFLLAFLFAVFTVVADGPHNHTGGSAPSQITAATHHLLSPDLSDCPLCNWLTISYATPSPVRFTVPVAVAPLPVRIVPAAVVSCRTAVLNPSLRAPPFASFHV